MVDGFMSTPENFKAKVTPRSEKRVMIFRDEWAGLCPLSSGTHWQLNRRKASDLFASSNLHKQS
jgi:hypothetical protein